VTALTNHTAVDMAVIRVDADRDAPGVSGVPSFSSIQGVHMRNILRIPRLMILVGLAVAACRSSTEPPSRASSIPAARGTDAPPPAQTAALLCQAPLRACVSCTGAQICAIRCPECAPPVTAQPEAQARAQTQAQIVCRFPQRSCISCTGAQICSIQCPECAPPATGKTEGLPETLALGPAVASCGGTICAPGTSCCNPSCGICTPKGVNCTQQSCN
jgi:hypothetical protein